ncbi:unnamed protein product [Blepharisma stoltei]|uniref:Uncharacterized protein n=1 Tax=Blepharisma stoltei TaxID=1481888 RepID=A0AAU9J737_9CILI|nr:unnamed protein product [Blepharisma stoltei]
MKNRVIIHDHLTTKPSCNGNSKSTIQLEEETDNQKQSFAEEVEEITSFLSTSHGSIQTLLDQCRKATDEYQSLRRQLNHLKFTKDLNEATKDVKIGLLHETINKKTEEVKMMAREKKRVEKVLKNTEKARKDLHTELRNKETLIRDLEQVNNKETISLANLYYEVTLAAHKLAQSEKKADRLEDYIRTHYKNKR